MNAYEEMSLEQLEQLDLDYFRKYRTNGGTSEFDLSINDISRARIDAFRRERGTCFLGNINLWDKDRGNPGYRFTPYTGQQICDFEYKFGLPVEDETLRALIVEHNRKNMTFDIHAVWQRVQQITSRVQQIGGIILTWA